VPDTGGQDETVVLSFNGPEEMRVPYATPDAGRHVICRQ